MDGCGLRSQTTFESSMLGRHAQVPALAAMTNTLLQIDGEVGRTGTSSSMTPVGATSNTAQFWAHAKRFGDSYEWQ
jgi:hypothetical protein